VTLTNHNVTSIQKDKKIMAFFSHLEGFFVILHTYDIVVGQCHITLVPRCHPSRIETSIFGYLNESHVYISLFFLIIVPN